jgi:glycosyltransferase involved in cell wall biosynthesis
MSQQSLFSIMTLAYRRLDYLRQAVEAMQRQSYRNIEIVIVNNGAVPEVLEYLKQLESREPRVKLVHFEKNQYSNDDPMGIVDICFNAGLKAATGEYFWYQSDDDLIAEDFVEKMVELFQENPACTSAAALAKSMDAKGNVLEEARTTNFRPRYMPGHLLALSTLNHHRHHSGSLMFDAPGSIFVFRREELIRAGGYHRDVERSHLYGIVPFGVTGFDETAILYWRRHEEQLNKSQTAQGFTGFDEAVSLLKNWQIKEKWQVYGQDMASYVVQRIYETSAESATAWFVINLYFFRPKSSWRLFKSLWNQSYFWRRVFVLLWTEKKYFKYYLKPKFRRFFESNPGVIEKFPMLTPLHKKAFK